MEIYNLIIQPFLLGLSTGVFCISRCLPFVASYMVIEKRANKEDLKVILKFILGRFIGYACLGAFFGYLGERVDNLLIDLILDASLVILGAVLVFYAVGLIRKKGIFCLSPRMKKKTPLVMGFLMGMTICPPLLMSLAYVFTLHNWAKGLVFFSMFFIATSLYFLPLALLGFLNERKEFQSVGRMSALIIGISFFFYYLYNILIKF